MKNLKEQLIRLGHQKPELRTHLRPVLDVVISNDEVNSEFDMHSRFEKGKPADPTENMSEEDAIKWKYFNEKYDDKFKDKESSVKEQLIRLGSEDLELRPHLIPVLNHLSSQTKVAHLNLKKNKFIHDIVHSELQDAHRDLAQALKGTPLGVDFTNKAHWIKQASVRVNLAHLIRKGYPPNSGMTIDSDLSNAQNAAIKSLRKQGVFDGVRPSYPDLENLEKGGYTKEADLLRDEILRVSALGDSEGEFTYQARVFVEVIAGNSSDFTFKIVPNWLAEHPQHRPESSHGMVAGKVEKVVLPQDADESEIRRALQPLLKSAVRDLVKNRQSISQLMNL